MHSTLLLLGNSFQYVIICRYVYFKRVLLLILKSWGIFKGNSLLFLYKGSLHTCTVYKMSPLSTVTATALREGSPEEDPEMRILKQVFSLRKCSQGKLRKKGLEKLERERKEAQKRHGPSKLVQRTAEAWLHMGVQSTGFVSELSQPGARVQSIPKPGEKRPWRGIGKVLSTIFSGVYP